MMIAILNFYQTFSKMYIKSFSRKVKASRNIELKKEKSI